MPAHLSDVLGSHDPLAHESARFLRPGFNYIDWKQSVISKLSRSAKSDEAVKHHIQHYDSAISVWLLLEVVDFRDSSVLFTGLTDDDQQAVTTSLGLCIHYNDPRRNPFSSWLKQLTIVRNTAMHHARLWNRGFIPVSSAAFSSTPGFYVLPTGQSEHILGALTMISHLLAILSPQSSWPARIKDLITNDLSHIPHRYDTELGCTSNGATSQLWQ
ncbi:hypothetical protein CRD60_06590 [Bifidobacterium aemilianum]|uniref:CAAX protease n=1 Tax=Bifidobacterium aemilianum TaxID=2493120 RepID=A0A366K702_9BIFI|nr:hypothetical protein CRD60_06590 [Bifidobacterium aemilianum]